MERLINVTPTFHCNCSQLSIWLNKRTREIYDCSRFGQLRTCEASILKT